MQPNGSPAPRFRLPAPGLAAATVPLIPGRPPLRRRRHAGHRGGHDPPGPRQPAGLGGPLLAGHRPGTRLAGRRRPARPRRPAAWQVYRRAGQATVEARAAVVAAKDSGHRRGGPRVDAVNAYLEGKGPLPDGLGVTAAQQKVEAARGRRRAGRRGRQPSPPAVGESVAAGRLGRSPPPGRTTPRPRRRAGGRLAADQAQPAAHAERRPDRVGRDLAPNAARRG